MRLKRLRDRARKLRGEAPLPDAATTSTSQSSSTTTPSTTTPSTTTINASTTSSGETPLRHLSTAKAAALASALDGVSRRPRPPSGLPAHLERELLLQRAAQEAKEERQVTLELQEEPEAGVLKEASGHFNFFQGPEAASKAGIGGSTLLAPQPGHPEAQAEAAAEAAKEELIITSYLGQGSHEVTDKQPFYLKDRMVDRHKVADEAAAAAAGAGSGVIAKPWRSTGSHWSEEKVSRYDAKHKASKDPMRLMHYMVNKKRLREHKQSLLHSKPLLMSPVQTPRQPRFIATTQTTTTTIGSQPPPQPTPTVGTALFPAASALQVEPATHQEADSAAPPVDHALVHSEDDPSQWVDLSSKKKKKNNKQNHKVKKSKKRKKKQKKKKKQRLSSDDESPPQQQQRQQQRQLQQQLRRERMARERAEEEMIRQRRDAIARTKAMHVRKQQNKNNESSIQREISQRHHRDTDIYLHMYIYIYRDIVTDIIILYVLFMFMVCSPFPPPCV